MKNCKKAIIRTVPFSLFRDICGPISLYLSVILVGKLIMVKSIARYNNLALEIFLGIILLSLSSCIILVASNDHKIYPLPERGIIVKENKIYSHGDLFAELFYFGTLGQGYRGLAIYYYPYSRVIWLYPKENKLLRLRVEEYDTLEDIKNLSLKYKDNNIGFLEFFLGNLSDEEVKFTRCFDISISADGKYVYYKTPGIPFVQSHKYLVEYGVSK